MFLLRHSLIRENRQRNISILKKSKDKKILLKSRNTRNFDKWCKWTRWTQILLILFKIFINHMHLSKTRKKNLMLINLQIMFLSLFTTRQFIKHYKTRVQYVKRNFNKSNQWKFGQDANTFCIQIALLNGFKKIDWLVLDAQKV